MITLNFTEKEKITILNKLGYTIRTMDCTKYEDYMDTYGGKFKSIVKIAYKNSDDELYNGHTGRFVNQKIGLNNVFENVISDELKKIILNNFNNGK